MSRRKGQACIMPKLWNISQHGGRKDYSKRRECISGCLYKGSFFKKIIKISSNQANIVAIVEETSLYYK